MIDLFRIGVHIGMTSNAAQVLGLMLRHLTGVHASTQQINANLGKMALLAGGAIAAFAGFEALKGIWHVVEGSRKLNDELTRTKQLGGEFASTIGAARGAAFRTAAEVPTFAPSEMVRMQRELGSQLQNPSAAIDVLPLAAKTAAVVSHYTGEDQETIIKNLVKIVDLRAKLFSMDAQGHEFVDKTKLGPELEAAAKGLILGGNYLKSNDLLMMARQSGVPVKTMSQEAFYAAMVEMAVSQGAQRAGTSASSMFSQMVGGVMPQRVAKEMQSKGLLGADEWRAAKGGSVILEDSATHRFQEAMKDPIAYITGPLNDLLTKQGLNQEQKILEVYRLFGRETTRRFVAEALSAGPQFERARAMAGNIPGIEDQWKTLQKENLSTNITALTKAWQGFIEALGDAGVPSAIMILGKLTDGLHWMTAAIEAHPEAAAHLLQLSTALSALLVVGGTLTVATIALNGLLIPLRGLVSLGGGMLSAGAGLASIAAGLARLLGPIGVFLAIMKPSETNAGEAGALKNFKAMTPDEQQKAMAPEEWYKAHPGIAKPPPRPAGNPEDFELGNDNTWRRKGSQQSGGGGSWDGLAAAIKSALTGSPMPVTVTNGRDLADGVTKRQTDQMNRPLAGQNGPDLRISPLMPGTAGGWGAP